MSGTEFLVAPLLMSQLVRSAPPKFAGTFTGMYFSVMFFTNKLTGQLSDGGGYGKETVLGVLGAITLVLAISFFLLDRFSPKPTTAI